MGVNGRENGGLDPEASPHILDIYQRDRQMQGNFSKSRGREVDRGYALVSQ
jgi:hypothetical protein